MWKILCAVTTDFPKHPVFHGLPYLPLEELPPGSTTLLGTRLEVQPRIAHRLVARGLSVVYLNANYQAQVFNPA